MKTKPQKKSFSYRISVIILAFFQNALLGGMLFGWTSISGSLLISDESAGGPGLSADYVHVMFVIASFFSCMGPLVMGIVLDNCGPRSCSILSIGLIGVGCLLFGFSTKNAFPMFIPAMCLIAIGGPGVLNATIHLSNLFPTWRSTTTAVITGSFQFSFLVFFIFDELWVEQEWSYSLLFSSYCVVCLINAIISITIWPDKPYSVEEMEFELLSSGETLQYSKEILGAIRLPEDFIHHPKPIAKSASMPSLSLIDMDKVTEDRRRSVSYDMATNDMPFVIELGTFKSSETGGSFVVDDKLPDIHVDVKELSFVEQLKSEEFMAFTTFFIVISFWVNFYIGSFGLQLGDSQILSGEADEQEFARLFTVVMTCGVIVIPVVGTMMDWAGFTITSAVTIGFGIIWSCLILIPFRTALIASFIAYTCFRTFFFTFLFAYIADTLGFKYFGALSGVMFVIGGVFGLLQYPLSRYAMGTCHLNVPKEVHTCSRGNWSKVNIIMLVTIILSLYFSYRDWTRRKMVLASQHQQQQVRSLPPSVKKSLNSASRASNGSPNVDNVELFERIPFARKTSKELSPPRYKSVDSVSNSNSSSSYNANRYAEIRQEY